MHAQVGALHLFCILRVQHVLRVVFCFVTEDRLASYVFPMSCSALVHTTLTTRCVRSLPLAGMGLPLLPRACQLEKSHPEQRES